MNCLQSKVRKWEQSSRFYTRDIQLAKADSSSKIFSNNKVALLFFAVAHNDRDYGLWRHAGAFALRETTK
jgi:hypothetical protein